MKFLLMALALLFWCSSAQAEEDTKAEAETETEAAPKPPPVSDLNVLLEKIEQGLEADDDVTEHIREIKRQAYNGKAEAMAMLGDLHADGKGVYHSHSKAWTWYRQAARKKNLDAIMKVAHAFEWGKGVPRHMAKAKKWYERAAEEGNIEAMLWLARIYTDGMDGVRPDEKLADRWIKKVEEAQAAPTEEEAAEEEPAEEQTAEEEPAPEPVEQAESDAEAALAAANEKVKAQMGDVMETIGSVGKEADAKGPAHFIDLVQVAPSEAKARAMTTKPDAALLDFKRRYIAAVNGGNTQILRKLIHSETISCAMGDGPGDPNSFVIKEVRRPIPKRHTASMEPVLPDQPLFFEDFLFYPVRPTHRMRIDFMSEPGKTVSIIRDLIYHRKNKTWRIVTPCPAQPQETAEG